MRVKTFFRPSMVADSLSYSPSPSKSGLVVDHWLRVGLPIQVLDFDPASREDLCTAHSPHYVDGVLNGEISNGHGNNDATLNESFLWTVGSISAASQAALVDGIACSPTSGFHHASYGTGMGFCTFNGLIVAARKLLQLGGVQRVAIIDCDHHYGNGTEEIIDVLRLRDQVIHWTAGAHSWKPSEFLETLEDVASHINADVILYQAGADMHVDDPLGGLLSTEQMQARDSIVFENAKRRGLPLVWNLAGGYRAVESLLPTHTNTMHACCHAWELV